MTVVMDRESTSTRDRPTGDRSGVSGNRGIWTLGDRAAGTTLVLATPQTAPALWRRYIDTALQTYAARGVADALDYDEVVDGTRTRMFCAVLDDTGRVIAGLRVQGTYLAASDSHALVEWSGRPGRDALVTAIESRLYDGLIEVKAAFVAADAPDPSAVAAILARSAPLLLEWTGARHLMATAADYVLDRWRSSGGRVDESVEPTPYPTAEYRTQVMFWDVTSLARDAEPAVWARMRAEWSQLVANRGGYGPPMVWAA